MVNLNLNPLEPRGVSRGPTATMGESFSAMFGREQAVGETSAQGRLEHEAFLPFNEWFIDNIRPMDPQFFDSGLEGMADGPGSPLSMDTWNAYEGSAFAPDEPLMRRMQEEMTAAGVIIPEEFSTESVFGRKRDLEDALREEVHGYDEVLSRSRGLSGFVAQLGGGFAAGFDNAETIMTLPIGAAARTGVLATAAIEGAIAGTVEAAATPTRNEFLRELGLPEESVLENFIFGAMVGGTLGGTIKGAQLYTAPALSRIGRLISRPQDQRALASAAASADDPMVAEIGNQVLRDLEDADAAGGTPGAPRLEHEQRAQEATAAAESGLAPDIPDRPVSAVPRPSIVNGAIEEVSPRDLRIDPARFQFKSEADGGGITGKLRDVTEWNPEYAGITVVFEDISGQRFVADGHQRTGLARRIMDRDPAQDIRMAARVFREADGYTDLHVRQLAALKNIAEAADGMTNRMALDAAKVLRVSADAIKSLPEGPGIARATNLSRLSDDAFQLVINDVIPDRFGALVGNLVDDPKLHNAMVRLIEKTEPVTEEQARSIIRQALSAPVVENVTEDLFGLHSSTESLYLERAKVLERAMRLMREDERTFRVLNDRQAQIEGAGTNILDRATNAEMKGFLDQALYSVDKLAHRAGPISEALNHGAQAYKANGRLKDAAAGVVDAILADIRGQGSRGAGARPPRQNAKPAGTRAETSDPNEGFADPVNGPDVDSQIAATRLTDDVAEIKHDMADQVPIGIEQVDGENVARTVSRAELEEELVADEDFAEQLGFCLK